MVSTHLGSGLAARLGINAEGELYRIAPVEAQSPALQVCVCEGYKELLPVLAFCAVPLVADETPSLSYLLLQVHITLWCSVDCMHSSRSLTAAH
jgi:hypothetical protein